MSNVELNWEDPPPPARRTGRKRAVVEALKNSPGNWAVIEECAASSVGSVYRHLGIEVRGVLLEAKPNDASKYSNYKLYGRWPAS